MLIPVLLFILGLVMLIKGGDWFVDGATGIAQRFGIPELLIGATVVSIGTTLPEVMVSAQGALAGVGAMAYGNAIGSIICNTALISAVTIAIRPSKVSRSTLGLPVLFFFAAAVFYSFLAYTYGAFSRLHGVILLCIFLIYMIITVWQAIKMPPVFAHEHHQQEEAAASPLYKDILLLIVGAAVIAVGANLLVNNGTKIAEALGVPASVIALTFVALGTSLPELVTAITALAKGHGALSLGNIIGANLFNLVLVNGVAVTLNPFSVPTEKTIAGYNASLVVDVPVMLLVMVLLTIPALLRGKLSRWQGIVLLCIYFGFIGFQFFL